MPLPDLRVPSIGHWVSTALLSHDLSEVILGNYVPRVGKLLSDSTAI